jgi:signal transduction histidine kinase
MVEHNHAVGCGACDELLAREKAAHGEVEAESRSTHEFLLAITHELRGRLNAITGWAGILRSQMSADDEVCERAIDTIERNAWAQARLLDELLARIERPAGEPTAGSDRSSDAKHAQRR